ncbi:hypothetical protein [Pseudonocardia lacus]|uniref:hypothetical protein n=1 Tax=Pseudonocardia lacus TaxID=2835865 RepID=UPI001BDD4D13|nr:hypothetical protein [Pseudonocardia lacus]
MGPADPALLQGLDQVVARYGPGALHDPVALRAALRSVDGITADDVELLTAVAGCGVVRDLRAVDPTGPVLDAVIDTATRTVCAGAGPASDLTAERVRGAVAAFAAVDGSGFRVRWDGAGARPRRRRRVALLAVAVLVACGTAALGAVLLLGAAPVPATPDRFAVDQVALRYRALGATLLDGAASCARGAPQPGRTEVVSCAFDRWTMTLTSYDTASRLVEERDRSLAEAPEPLRSARSVEADGAFAMAETGTGSTVYWDTTLPRPVSARIATEQLGLLDLVARYDDRGAATATRPEPPGPEFASGELWRFTAESVGIDGARCAPVPAGDPARAGAVDAVRCTLPNGVTAELVQLATYDRLIGRRTAAGSDAGKVPGTLRGVGTWGFEEGTAGRGQFAEYVPVAGGDAHIYWDDESTRCVALISHPDLTQDQLLDFWRE